MNKDLRFIDRSGVILEIFYNNAKLSSFGVPQIASVMGPCIAGGAYLPVMCDKYIIVDGASMFLAGPALVKGAIGHEMSHVANGDMVTLTLIQGIVNAFVIFFSRVIGHFVDRVILKNERGYGIGYFFTVIFAQVILGILASTIVCWFSRMREFRADIGGAQLTSKTKMINALKALERQVAAPLPDQMLAFGISNKGQSSTLQKLFSTHPPLRKRIEALENSQIESASQQQLG